MKRLARVSLAAVAGFILLASLTFALDIGIYNITMLAGEDYTLPMTMNVCADNPQPTDPSKCVNVQPVNLDGYSYKSQFRSAPYPAGVLYTTYSTVFVNLSAGRVDLKLSAAQTAALSGKSGTWDLRETSPNGSVTYRTGGTVNCKPTNTR